MTAFRIHAEFKAGATNIASLPVSDLPEVALIGRSNVGKSSLINRLTNQKKLARTSATPGRTKQFNFFEVELTPGGRSKRQVFHLVDLPGFGFAQYSQEMRQQLNQFSVDYISQRQQLKILLILNDVRRNPEADEIALQRLSFDSGLHTLIVLTKCDKLKPSELKSQTKLLAQQYHLVPEDFLLSGENLTSEPILRRVFTLLGQ